MKTLLEIEALKRNWTRDPCYEIEDTEGFEEHYEELKTYNQEMKAHWKEQVQKHHAELAAKVCPIMSIGASDYELCHVELCAWWNAPDECCSIRGMLLRR